MRKHSKSYRDPLSGMQPAECAVCGGDNWNQHTDICGDCQALVPPDLPTDPAAVAEIARLDPWGTAPTPPIGDN